MLEKYDMYGMPISLGRWIQLFEFSDRHVGDTYIKREDKHYRVSTIWLGLDHNFTGEGPPIIFETMVFTPDGEEGQYRYPNLESARLGHKAIVWAIRRYKLKGRKLIHKGGKP
jgi:hypothetical protein